MIYVEIGDRFHSLIALLYRYFPEAEIANYLELIIAEQEVDTAQPFLVSALYGLYYHQYSSISNLVDKNDLPLEYMVLMQTIVRLCGIQPYQFVPDQFANQLCQDLPELEFLANSLHAGSSLISIQRRITAPILLGLYCWLYMPYSPVCQAQLLERLDISPEDRYQCKLVVEIASALLFPHNYSLNSKCMSDRFFSSWQGKFNPRRTQGAYL